MQLKFFAFAVVVVQLALAGCITSRTISSKAPTSINGLQYLGKYELPHNFQFKGTTVGGLSGIDYDPVKGVYYLICDDNSTINAARFYTARITANNNGISKVEFVAVNPLRQKNGEVYPNASKNAFNTVDPESIRFNPVANQFYWTSEGERIVKKDTILINPSINVIDWAGRLVEQLPIPKQLTMQPIEKGPRKNGTLEGLSFSDNYQTVFAALEEPLYEDGPRAKLEDTATWIRLLQYEVKTKKSAAQFAYKLEPVAKASVPAEAFKINGVSDILALSEKQLLVVERSFSSGVASNTIRIYLADLSNATNIDTVSSLLQTPPAMPVAKKLLLNTDSLNITVDNVEGVTFGPTLPNGRKTLVLVTDNNFDPKQKTQFLLFEIL